MNKTTIAAATAAVAGALTIMSAVAPTAASARRVDPNADPVADPAGRCAVSTEYASSTASMDIAKIVTMLKVRRAKYLYDHPYLLR